MCSGRESNRKAAAKTSAATRRHRIDQPSDGGEKDRCARQSGGVAKKRAASGGWATVKIGSGMSCEGGEADCVAQRKRRKDTE